MDELKKPQPDTAMTDIGPWSERGTIPAEPPFKLSSPEPSEPTDQITDNDSTELELVFNGNAREYFRIWIADDRRPDVEIELESRSKGFQWFGF